MSNVRLVVNPGRKVRAKAMSKDMAAGEEFELPEKEAKVLIATGYASKVVAQQRVESAVVNEPVAVSTYSTAAMKVEEEPRRLRGRPPLSEEERARRTQYRRSDMRAED